MSTWRLSVFTVALLAFATRAEAQAFRYTNPNPQLPLRDTTILANDDGRFYAVGTSAPVWQGQGQGPSPGVRLYSSANLKDWRDEGLMIDAARLPDDVWYKDRFWAPEIHKIRGRYYITFNSRNESEEHEHHHACGVAVADEVTGPYEVLTHDRPLTDWPSNDLTLFEDDDGKVYAFFNNGWTPVHHIFVAELDLDTMKFKEEPIRCISQEPGWDAHGIEGAFVVKHEGTYYLFYSSWTRGYAVGYATATDIRGPWTKHPDNPLFGAVAEGARGIRYGKPIDDPDFPYTHVGHNAVFRGPDGRWWIVCHAQRKDNRQEMMLIDPFWFDDDGNIRTHAPTYTPQEVTIDPEMLRRFPGLAE